jgi:hypothetical protein
VSISGNSAEEAHSVPLAPYRHVVECALFGVRVTVDSNVKAELRKSSCRKDICLHEDSISTAKDGRRDSSDSSKTHSEKMEV